MNNISRVLLACTVLFGSAMQSHAQINPFQTMYFQNKYLYNPAMAGLDKGLDLNVNYRQQWSSFPGSPKTSALTADYQATDKVGLGINLNDDESGLFKTTRIMGTYAYHLPLNDKNEHLNFGISLGVNNSRIDYSKINGDQTDEEIAQYNGLKPFIDGDLGVAYTSNNLYVGVVMPNLRSTFFNASDERFDANGTKFIGVASYKIPLKDDASFTIEPLAAFRILKGYDNVLDFGANLAMNNYGLYLQGIYHTSKTLGLGFGWEQQSYGLNFAYNLETGPINNYVNGGFELGLKIKLFGK